MKRKINDDFDLQKIADSGQCFRWERMDEHTYRILNGAECLYVTVVKKEGESAENPGESKNGISRSEAGRNGSGNEKYDCEYEFDCSEEEFDSIWHAYFDLEERYAAIRDRVDPQKDPFLWKAAEQEKGIRILRQDAWEMLVTFLISQNRNIPAIRHSVELLSEKCGEKRTDKRGKKYHAFPSPRAIAALSEEELKSCSLGYRWKYVKAAAEAVLAGKIDLERIREAEEEETIAQLTGLYGVGEKVANCVSLFGLHHINAFPRDVWVNRVLSEEYPDGYPFAEYAPYNGIYQQYMFAYYRKQRQLPIIK